ncbi:helix-hairpin-helix domain-containing protein [Jatrophihabitans fulvus]
MRDGSGRRGELRGESARVSERVRALLDEATGGPPDDDGADRDGGLLDRVAARFPVRADPGRRTVLALAAVVVVVALGVAVWLLGNRPDAVPVSAQVPSVPGSALAPSGSVRAIGSSASAPTSAPAASSASAGLVVVDVAGKVRRPGVYRLPAGSRVDDAIRAAGGALRGVDLGVLNLAAVLVDGQQVAVGRPAAAPGPAMTAGAPTAGSAGPSGGLGALVNLNSATLEQLEALPGIGPALGQRILDYRTEHGSFATVDDLNDVSGIGDVTFGRLKPLVTV